MSSNTTTVSIPAHPHNNTMQYRSSRFQERGRLGYILSRSIMEAMDSSPLEQDIDKVFLVAQNASDYSGKIIVNYDKVSFADFEDESIFDSSEKNAVIFWGTSGNGKSFGWIEDFESIETDLYESQDNEVGFASVIEAHDFRDDGFNMDWKLAAEISLEIDQIRKRQKIVSSKECKSNDSITDDF